MRNQLAILLASLLFFGCGVKKETHQKVLDELAATQLLLEETRAERDHLQADRATLLSDKAEADKKTKERLARLEAEKEKMLEQLK